MATTKRNPKRIDWKELCNPHPVLFHGDLQPENIIYTKKKLLLAVMTILLKK